MAETFKPNCRYGHGDLIKLSDKPDHPHAFSINSMYLAPGVLPEIKGGLMLEAFECPVCGYTELFEKRTS